MSKEVRIERDQLYKEIWSEPISKLGPKYHISDVGLLNICRKLEVPVPGRGYWAKKIKKRLPLLPMKGGNSYFIHKIREESEHAEVEYDEESKALIAFEKAPENKIIVPRRLSSPHPLVANTQAVIEPPKEGDEHVPRGLRNKCIDMRVSHTRLSRALKICDALFKAMEERGFEISAKGDKNTRVTVLGVTGNIIIEEIFEQKKRRLTTEELINDLTGRWIPNRYVMMPTNRLRLRLEAGGDGIQKQWRDGKEQRIEDCLNNFIIGVIRAAVELKQRQLEWQKRTQEQIELGNAKFEKMRQIEEEKRRIEQLDKQIDAWNKSERIRQFIEVVKKLTIEKKGSILPGSDIDKWILWATAVADSVDPLIESD